MDLPDGVKLKIKKYEDYVFLQENQNIKPCSQVDCGGYIDMRYQVKKCNRCDSPHCPKCLKVFHEGACVLDDFDQSMKEMNYQKCPKCGMWVEKKEGCEYINCKCGTAFCYRCGAEFSSDPCRK